MTRAYYNEFDPKAAAWLEELIRQGLIADGDVDTRSIKDVAPRDVRGYTQCHFFAGIGGWSYALRLAGWRDDRRVWTGSCPCQPFSVAGRGDGVADERHLWPSFFHLIEIERPPVIFGEQVASKPGLAWLDLVHADLEGAGYSVGAADLCAAGVGAPHIRQRLYFVADSGRERRDRQSVQLQQREPRPSGAEVTGSGDAGGMDHPLSPRLEGHAGDGGNRHEPGRDGAHPPGPVGAAGGAGIVAESDSGQRDGRAVTATRNQRHGQDAGWAQGDGGPTGSRSAGDLGHADDAGPQERQQQSGEQPGPQGRESAERSAGLSGLHGFWSAADWLPCRDGKVRPVEPGTFPLAHGLPARVGRLRGYGNAIVPQVAEAFIRAYDS